MDPIVVKIETGILGWVAHVYENGKPVQTMGSYGTASQAEKAARRWVRTKFPGRKIEVR